MTWPAYEALAKDIELGFAQWRVYMYLVHTPVLDPDRPVEVKVDGLAESLGMSRRKVRSSLNWLVARGYLREHGRDARGVRSLTFAWRLRLTSTAA